MASRKVALVTGGNNGIGYETVKALLQSKRPYHLLVGSRSIEKGKLAIDKLRKECPDAPNTLELLQVDLTSDESIEKAFEKVKASPGHLDVLINNAGSSPLWYPWLSGKTKTSQAQPLTSNSSPDESPSASASRNPTT